ncbi:MAG: phosphopyruvate hydratase [Eubacteriales bacterium]|nr:phosphopyruvate hydratase [Eubacteriales bacterium]
MEFCIKEIRGREVIDSRGFPTVECDVILYDGTVGRGIVPSGASTGAFEAHELRDKDPARYNGKGVLRAVGMLNCEINRLLSNINVLEQRKIDRILADADGTINKQNLGANAVLAASIACAHAASNALGIELFQYLGGFTQPDMPIPMMNILNGGAHASSNIDIQEFMIVPVGADTFAKSLRWCSEVYHALKSLLKSRSLSTTVGDEGGFAPDLPHNETAIELILDAIRLAGFNTDTDFKLAMDAAASEWYNNGIYILPKAGIKYSTENLISYWKKLSDQYPIFSIEDPLGENDWEGWKNITGQIGSDTILVGDDLFVTNTVRLQKGISESCGNAILIKPNQIGTLTETIDAVLLARSNGYKAIISHRSGETEDTTIADLSVALNTGLIKSGAPARGERTCKYNRLLRIEEALGQY